MLGKKRRARPALRAVGYLWVLALCVRGMSAANAAEPIADLSAPIHLQADWSQDWQEGVARVGLFRGQCRVAQGDREYLADQMVIWHRTSDTPMPTDRLEVYLEGNVRKRTAARTETLSSEFVSLSTTGGINLTQRGEVHDQSGQQDPVYRRAVERRDGRERSNLLQTQLTVEPLNQPPITQVPLEAPGLSMRRVRVSPRSFSTPFNADTFQSNDTNPPEQIAVITGGVNVLVDDVTIDGFGNVGTIDLTADRVVIWTTALDGDNFSMDNVFTRDTPYQVYLEGNIVIRQGESVVRAERAFYDAREDRALILNAELRTELPQFGTTVRLRAEELRQISRTQYQARNAWVTTSPYGRPGYRLQASEILYEERLGNIYGREELRYDPNTGMQLPVTQKWITAHDTTFLANETPLFYLPVVSAPAEDPNIPLESINFGQDRIFGTQIRTRWNAFQLFGMERPPGVRWSLDFDYLSDRGPAIGTSGSYRGVDGGGNIYRGKGLGYYIYDDGSDNLGLDRRDLPPPDRNRGIVDFQHRHIFFNDLILDAQLGYASDRNFREQYFESDFDRGQDLETLLHLRQSRDVDAWSILVRPQINQFENNTQWLPKGDYYVLGMPLLNGLINWSSHTSGGYGSLNQAKPPTDPNDLFTPLPYYAGAEGLVAATRHELEMPFDLGPVRVTPYALGEAAYWGDSLTGDAIDRYYGRAGVRGSITWWRVFPDVQSDVFNLTGLAHKSTLDADFGFAESSRDLSEIAQFNEFDDDAQERFRERFVVNTFGGVLDPIYDPRYYAVRSGAATSVTAPAYELVDDQQALRLNWSHRLQTKVGPPEQPRIKDWMTLDLGTTIFPRPDDDNFGEVFGLFSTRYAWYVGDRTSLHASSLVDFFDGGQQLWSVGVLSQRSLRGSLYVGLRQIKAGEDLNSQIVTASYSYAMSPKWVSTMSTAYDIAEGEDRGQSLTISRIGLDWIFHIGANVDASKNNVGFGISLEPRFGSLMGASTQLGSLLGVRN